MDNQQAIQWFSGFFEGEGSFSLRRRKSRGKKSTITIIEPKISVSNTNRKAISLCEQILCSWFLSYSISVSNRPERLPCYSLDITSHYNVEEFCKRMTPHLEGDGFRCKILKDYCHSRLSRKRYSETNQYELDLLEKLRNWRASETTRDKSFRYSIDWLAGVYEAESCITKSLSNQLIFQFCNTNNLIVEKVDFHLQKLDCGHHLKWYPPTSKHQSYWYVTIYGTNKVKRFWNLLEPHLRYRREEWQKIMI